MLSKLAFPAAKIARTLSTSMQPAVTGAKDSIIYAPVTKVSSLSNGLRIASESAVGDTATVGVWIDAGSRYETEKNNGVANFLEHMVFKGTNKRTQQQLEIEIDNIGGQVNAYTLREQTVYYAKVYKKDVPKAIEILSDIVQNAQLDEKVINREREVILRAVEEANKNYEEQLLNHLHEASYLGGGLGRTILGSEENIKILTRSDLVDYMNTHYTAPKLVVAGAGAIDHKQLVDLSEQYFGKLPTASKNSTQQAQTILEPGIFTGSDKRIRFDSMKECHVALAFEGSSWTSEYFVPFMLMQSMLGAWDRTSPAGRNMASRLARHLSHEESVHSFMTFNTSYKDTGLFGVYFIAQDNGLEAATHHVLSEMVRLCHEVTEEELQRSKTQLKTKLLMQTDSFAHTCEDIGRQILTYGRRIPTVELFTRIDSVTVADIHATADKFINDEDHALAAVGPLYELPDYNWIRRRSFWHRY